MNSVLNRCSRALLDTLVGLAAAKGQTIKAYEIVGSALDPAAQVTKKQLTVSKLLAPLSNEEVKVVRCLGLNYSDHAVGCFEDYQPRFTEYTPTNI